ncbi:acetolactate synthase [Myxococcus stipitatus DSM 14675]|uniref:Acetolactate synthase n=1 Tax=Myxococcus stipitatus (strain DSM 14675 / JCM 12634 / Mx s8) TaxID=1278073 RepID=L7UG99_MYXSD|nr:thiamine pyrophosphate-dependent enzyme [Myxococcus stipitatus]AGC47053.1 acetolactate synthase [Myxococcus stipitatus DSM 14675]
MSTATSGLTGYEALFDAFTAWGITTCTGVTGGGLLHLLRHMEPYPREVEPSSKEGPRFFSLGEYAAGFVPLGSYLATGALGCCVATTGAATKLLSCGLSDAKLHDIPAVFLVPLASATSHGLCPLQDTSVHGNNIVDQLEAELPGGVFLLDEPSTLVPLLRQAQQRLQRSKPVVLVIEPMALNQHTGVESGPFSALHPLAPDATRMREFVETFRDAVDEGRRVVILAGEELARVPRAGRLTTQLCELLGAPIVWSINGANGVERQNPMGHGYISFGGNDAAMALWSSLGEEDILLVLGACPDEYTVNLQPYNAGKTFVITSLEDGYGQANGSFAHRARHAFLQWVTPLDSALHALVEQLAVRPPRSQRARPAPADLNDQPRQPPRPGHVDMRQFFSRLDRLWAPGTIGFDDVCLSYKDRQYITQRPNPNARFFSLYRGSAMGNVLGLCIGARQASPEGHVVGFTGDGCFRLFAGCLSEASTLDLLLFVLDNGNYGIVEQVLPVTHPGLAPHRHHTAVTRMGYGDVARACGWMAFDLKQDLSNLDAIMGFHRARPGQSILVTVPVDTDQVLGPNPRANNL